MSSKYPKEVDRAMRYSAWPGGLPEMLAALTDRDRWGRGDHTKRGIIADYLQDLGRDGEANLLRSGEHVVVHEGKVKRGRFNLHPLEQATRSVDDLIHEPTPRTGYHRMDYGLDFVSPDQTGYINEPALEQDGALPGEGIPAYQSLPDKTAHHWDDETNTPVVRWNDHTCADGEVPAGSHCCWSRHTAFASHPRENGPPPPPPSPGNHTRRRGGGSSSIAVVP